MLNIEKKVEELVSKPIEELGYKLYDVIYTKEGRENYLKIFIDKDSGISLEDCEKVNNVITDMLDEENYIKEQYFLEVSSPGIERLIRKDVHLKENIGNEIYVKTFSKIQETGEKEVIGILQGYNNDEVTVDNITINRNNIALMKKNYKWN